jgi:hypothetical protein
MIWSDNNSAETELGNTKWFQIQMIWSDNKAETEFGNTKYISFRASTTYRGS